MTLAVIILLVIAGTFVRADVEEPPYKPAGWQPSGAPFSLPARNPAFTTQLNNEPFPTLVPPPPPTFSKSEGKSFVSSLPEPASTPNSPTRPPTSNNRRPKESTETRFIQLFDVRALTPISDFAASTSPSSPANDHRLTTPGNPYYSVRTNPANQDNRAFVRKSESVLSLGRRLPASSQSDDQALPLTQNQSPFSKQYLPPSEGNDGNAPSTDPDNVADYSASYSDDDLRYQASLTDSELPTVNNQPLFPINNADRTSQPSQEYGVPSALVRNDQQNAPRIFFVVLPVKQTAHTGADSEYKQAQSFASRFTGDRLLTSTNQATPERSPGRLIL